MKTESVWILVKNGPYSEDADLSMALENYGAVMVFSSVGQALRHIDLFMSKNRRDDFRPVEVEIKIKDTK